MRVKDADVWKDGKPWVRDGGVWKPAQKGFVRDAGVWKEFYSGFTPTHFMTIAAVTHGANSHTAGFRRNMGGSSTPDGALSPDTIQGRPISGLGVWGRWYFSWGQGAGLGFNSNYTTALPQPVIAIEYEGYGVVPCNGFSNPNINATGYFHPTDQIAPLRAYLEPKAGQTIGVKIIS